MTFNLYIMRHAKSDWSGADIADFDRPINQRGQQDAKRLGQWMREENHIPQLIISSPALRAKQTIELVTAPLNCGPEKIRYEKTLYLADQNTLITSIKTAKADLNSLMLVAHNPGLNQLVHYLQNRGLKENFLDQKMGTANLAIFQFQDCKFDPEIDKGRLVAFINPLLI